jgi:ABC-type glycerol-3-phosphate transport system substrate-binding protein
MRRRAVLMAMLAGACAVLGCGGSDTTVATGPAGDNRSPEQKESDDMMQKAIQKYQKKGTAGRR